MALIPNLPVTLQNGTTADATQVMANFTAIVAAVNANAANAGINTNITQLQGLTVAVGVNQGGTGQQILTPNGVLLGEGTTGINAVAPGTAGYALVSNGPGQDPSYGAVSLLANNITLPGNPTCVTQNEADSSNYVANTNFVHSVVTALGALVAGNNLSDLTNLTNALANLGFSASIGGSGWIKFPDVLGGLIIQWGVCGTGGTAFPRSFPRAVFGAVPNMLNNNGGSSPQNVTLSYNNNSISAFVTNTPSNCFYIAVGY